EPQRGLVVGQRTTSITVGVPEVAAVVVCLRELRIETQGLAVIVERTIHVAVGLACRPPTVVGNRVGGVEEQHAVPEGERVAPYGRLPSSHYRQPGKYRSDTCRHGPHLQCTDGTSPRMTPQLKAASSNQDRPG